MANTLVLLHVLGTGGITKIDTLKRTSALAGRCCWIDKAGGGWYLPRGKNFAAMAQRSTRVDVSQPE
jgi:hypothetical protein